MEMKAPKGAMGLSLALLLALGLPGCQRKPEAAAGTAAAVAWASYPGPTFLENLYVAADGAVYFTNYTGRSIERRTPDGVVSTFALMDSHPVSLAPLGDGFLAAVQSIPFTQADFAGTGRLLLLDGQGQVIDAIEAAEAGFLNGMVALPDGSVLIADSLKAQILRFLPGERRLEVWLTAPELAPQTQPAFLPGANGLKLLEGALVVSSSARKTLFRVALTPDWQPAGALEPLVADLPSVDDFVPLPEGGFLVATHGETVLRVGLNGETSVLTADPRVLGSTAVALVGTGADRKALVLGTGGFTSGGSDEAVLLAVPAPPEAGA